MANQPKNSTENGDKTPAAEHQKPSATKSGQTPAESGETPTETGGPKGLEPTRYGDWEQNGRCTDF